MNQSVRGAPLSNRFEGKVGIVTGGANGIGAATVRRLAFEGCAVVVADLDQDAGVALAGSLTSTGSQCLFRRCDVSHLDDWLALADEVRQRFGRLDFVHNNAFFRVVAPAETLGEQEWARQIDVTLKSVFLSAKVCMPMLTDAHGSMLNTSSVQSFIGVPGHPAYAAAKGGINAITRQLAVDYGPKVRVNALLPGSIYTDSSWKDTPAVQLEEHSRHIILGRLGRPDEVAAAACFLLSDDASYITGVNMIVDGGLSVTKA